MISWHLEVLPVNELKDYSKNPREIKKDQLHNLESLITKYGLIDKPIVNQDLTLIGGHQRVRILKKMKTKSVECWVPDRQLTEEEVDHLCVGLNLNQGQWDYEKLGNEWDALKLLEYGFTEEQLLGCFEDDLKEESDSSKKNKKKKSCPACGHEFQFDVYFASNVDGINDYLNSLNILEDIKMTLQCFDCEKKSDRYWSFGSQRVCGPCSGWRHELQMRKSNETKLFLFNGQLHNAARTFTLPAVVFKGKGDVFPDIDRVQAVFDNSVWTGNIAWDNIDGMVLMKRTKKRYMPNGDEI